MKPDLFTLGLESFLPIDKLLSDCPGVYIGLRDGQVLYVGQSKSVRHRTRTHERTKAWAKPPIEWVVYRLADEDARLELEGHLILRYRPRWNQAIKLRIGKSGKLTEVSFLRTTKTTTPFRFSQGEK